MAYIVQSNLNPTRPSVLTVLIVTAILILMPMSAHLKSAPGKLEGVADSGFAPPPGVGSTNLTVLNTTQMSGNQSYDDLYIGCGITAPCGSIIATGDLVLTVNTLTVANGGSIVARDYATNSQGVGTSIQLTSSWSGDGAGGAGHYGSGGSGGGVSSGSNGGSGYGIGNETGSNGGSIFDSSGGLVSPAGEGGGRIVIYADTIEIYGTVSASGYDGDPGYRYNNGSGSGGPGAGGGSGGSIIMRANNITIGGSSGGSVLADGGDGGDGADGYCMPGNPCLFMYDGGHGGGGGSGGSVDIRASSSSNLLISSSATISAASGSGGSGGAHYGTGAAGSAGSSGSIGNSTSGTWAGWTSSGSGGGTGSNPTATLSNLTNTSVTLDIANLDVNNTYYWWTFVYRPNSSTGSQTWYSSGYRIITNSSGGTYYPYWTDPVAMGGPNGTYTVVGEIRAQNMSVLDSDTKYFVIGTSGMTSDSNEPNDTWATATQASTPSNQGNLSIHNTTDDDFFAISAIAGTTYWVNISFTHTQGDLDMDLYDSNQNQIDWSAGTGNSEFVTYTPLTNQTLYAQIFGYSGATNTYSITFAGMATGGGGGNGTGTGTEWVNISSMSETHGAWIYGNLSSTSTYEFDWYWTYWNGTAHNVRQTNTVAVSSTSGSNNVTHDPPAWAGTWCFFAVLWEQQVTNWSYIAEDGECLYHKIGGVNITSDTSGWITTENLTIGSTYTMDWYVTDSTWQTIHDQGNFTFVPLTSIGVQTNHSIQFNNSGPGLVHCFIVEIINSSNIIIERVWECWTTGVTPPSSGDLSATRLNDTAGVYDADNLTIGTNYSIIAEYSYWNGSAHNVLGNLVDSFQANQTTHQFNVVMTAYEFGGIYCLNGWLMDDDHSTNGTVIDSDMDCWQRSFVDVTVTSDSGGTVDLANLTDGASYQIHWWLLDGTGPSYSDSGMMNLTIPTGGASLQTINWTLPTTSGQRCFSATVTNSTGAVVESDYDCFAPTLPELNISTLTNTTVYFWANNITVGGSYNWSAALVYANNNTSYAQSGARPFVPVHTFVWHNWSWSMPNASGGYCVQVILEDSQGNVLDMDSDCFSLIHDQDGDGIWDENDLCPNTPVGSTVDINGCADSQRDTDGDGYTDDVDAFRNDSSQWADTDGDGYGDNSSGTNGDAFPMDSTQWVDRDGDGYGDNASGNSADAFPDDPNQWSDADDDGWGDEPGHNTSDAFPQDPTQWTDRDGDGYGDNPNGFNPDSFPDEPTQWSDRDGDRYGDNESGVSPDAFPDDPTQWSDRDGDGYGDESSGNNPDEFPDEPSQWSDRDGDGYGDNASGVMPDHCPDTPTSAQVDSNGCAESEKDDDLDQVMNDVDACPETPAGETVDATGCSASQKDSDRDGVADAFDLCPGSALGDTVNSAGCATWQRDTDGDSVNDDRDRCNDTAPQAVVDGYGCSADQRDVDEDGVSDAEDICTSTPSGVEVDAVGCAASERDMDDDGLTDDLDICPFTPTNESIDSDGCAKSQLDSDSDSVSDADDRCPRTPANESIDLDGCSSSQVDSDDDGVSDADDQCRNSPSGSQVDLNTGCPPDEDGDRIEDSLDQCRATPINESVDDVGCSKSQLDGDEDRVMDDADLCETTPATERNLVDAVGCGPSERDSDDDGTVDSEDAFPNDADESFDSDGDGVGDNADAYPEDAQASVAGELDSNMLVQVGIGLFVLALLAGIGTFVMRGREEGGSEDNENPYADDIAFDSMAYAGTKERNEETASLVEPQQWTDAEGNHWTQQPDGTILRWNGFDWEHYS